MPGRFWCSFFSFNNLCRDYDEWAAVIAMVRALNYECRAAIDYLATLRDGVEFRNNLRSTFQAEWRNRVAIVPDYFLAITDDAIDTIAGDYKFDRKHRYHLQS